MHGFQAGVDVLYHWFFLRFYDNYLHLSTMGDLDSVNEHLVSKIHEHYKDKLVSDINKKHAAEICDQRIKSIRDACNKAHTEASEKKEAYIKRVRSVNKIIFFALSVVCIGMTVKSWGSIPLSLTFGIFAIFSLLSLLDTVLSRKKRVDHYIQRRANQLETNIYEAKKKEYFSLLGVTDEDLKLFPQVE